MTKVIETVFFKLSSGISPEAFLEHAPAVTAYLKTCNGYITRDLSQNEEGEWLEYIKWQTLQDAQSAAAAIMNEPSIAPYMGCIDGASAKMSHRPLLLQDG